MGSGTVRRGRKPVMMMSLAGTLLLLLQGVIGIEHNLPDNVELVDPKDFGLDGQIDLDKLLGNVKALPIDGNAISSALGKPGLKTQVLTVGFDGSEGINLDDFELPQLKNDEHGPLAQAAFSSFKNFIRNSSSATHFGGEDARSQQVVTVTEQPKVTTHRPGGGKRKMMRRRKIVRVNGTTTPPSVQVTEPPPPQSQQQPAASSGGKSGGPGPKVIELDSSQIERLIASGKIGPPKSLTPGGPQVIELGQSDLDALLSSENGDEIKQILEGGDQVKDFDLSQLSSNSAPSQLATTTTRVSQETNRPIEYQTSPLPKQEAPVTPPVTQPPQVPTTTYEPTAPPAPAPREPVNVSVPVSQQDAPGLPIIYQYNSNQDSQRLVGGNAPPQPFQSAVPLQFYSSHANGQQQASLVKHPTFELISAPPVSFSSSVLPHPNGNQNQIPVQLPPQIPQVILGQPQQQQQQQQLQQQQQQLQQQVQQQQQQQLLQQLQQQHQQQFRNTFINPEASSQFHPAGPPPPSPISNEVVSTSNSNKHSDQTLNKIVAAKQQSSHTEQFKPSSPSSSTSQGNYIQTLHKVNLPHNSVKLVTPSPQVVHTILNQVPASFQPSLAPNHIVNSPVLDPYRLSNQQSSLFQNQEPFRNTQLFNSAPPTRPPPPPPVRSPSSSSSSSPLFRFPNSSSVFSSSSSSPRGPNRFRTSESSNPFFPPAASSGTSSFPNLVLNSFVAGDGLNYRPRSNQDFRAPGI